MTLVNVDGQHEYWMGRRDDQPGALETGLAHFRDRARRVIDSFRFGPPGQQAWVFKVMVDPSRPTTSAHE